jgi:thiol-disulfide isomerase/thioredoxin
MTAMATPTNQLPEWNVSTWLNSRERITLESLRGKVVVIHAFQMLCPGCMSHGLPQAERIRQCFNEDQVAVIGLHTVFEHHDVMSVDALRAFIHEYRWSFPIGVDLPAAKGPVPQTMATYRLQGTPTLIVLDRRGIVRLHHFGRIDDLAVGALLGQLLAEAVPATNQGVLEGQDPATEMECVATCSADSCSVDHSTT